MVTSKLFKVVDSPALHGSAGSVLPRANVAASAVASIATETVVLNSAEAVDAAADSTVAVTPSAMPAATINDDRSSSSAVNNNDTIDSSDGTTKIVDGSSRRVIVADCDRTVAAGWSLAAVRG